MFAPDEGPHHGEEFRPRLAVARAGPRLDIGRALPRPADTFVIALGGRHRDANRRDRRIGTQAQVGAEHIAFACEIRQKARHPPRDAHERGAGVVIAVVVEPAFIEKHDEVDVGGVVQLPCPHLAHRQRDHTARGLGVFGRKARNFAPRNLGADKAPQAAIDSSIGKVGERLRHHLERPNPTQIGQPGQKRHASLGLPQTIRELVEWQRGGG